MLIITILFCAFIFPILLYVAYLLYFRIKFNFVKLKKRNYSAYPPVSIIISSYNDALFLKKRLDTFLRKENWINGSEILVTTAGSTDNSEKILAEYMNDKRVKVFTFSEQTAKIKACNTLAKKAINSYLLFSDVRQELSKNPIRKLFDLMHEDVGIVTASLKAKHEKNSIRTLLNKIRIAQSSKRTCYNIHGALYLQKKEVYKTVPEELLFDDLFVTVSCIKQNKRIVQADDVFLYDLSFKSYYHKERIQRLVRGLLLNLKYDFKQIKRLKSINLTSFFLSKYLKLIIPICVLGAFSQLIIYAIITHQTFLLFTVCIFLLLSIIIKPTRLLYSYMYYILAAFMSFYIRQNRSNKWEKLKLKTTVW